MDAKMTKRVDGDDEVRLMRSSSASIEDHVKVFFPSRKRPIFVLIFFLAILVTIVCVVLLLLNIVMLKKLADQESTCSCLIQTNRNVKVQNSAVRDDRNAESTIEEQFIGMRQRLNLQIDKVIKDYVTNLKITVRNESETIDLKFTDLIHGSIDSLNHNMDLIKQYLSETNETKYSILDKAIEACAFEDFNQKQTAIFKQLGNLTDLLTQIVAETKGITDVTEEIIDVTEPPKITTDFTKTNGITSLTEKTPIEKYCFYYLATGQRQLTADCEKCFEFTAADGTKALTHDYIIVSSQELLWHHARNYCNALGGYLAEVTSENEFDAIQGATLGGKYWLGGLDAKEEGKWKWDHSGEEFNFMRWEKDQPDNWKRGEDCLVLWETGKWNDASCDDRHYNYICEKISQRKVHYQVCP